MPSFLTWTLFRCQSAQEIVRYPAQSVLVVEGYQHDGPSAEVDPVDVDDPTRRLDLGRHRPDLPEAGAPPPEGPPAAGHVGLASAREEPAEEGLEQLRRVVDPPHRARAAGGAPPPRPSRARRAAPLHPRAAQGACVHLHRNPASPTNFPGRFSML